MPLVCVACGFTNPPGTRYCQNPSPPGRPGRCRTRLPDEPHRQRFDKQTVCREALSARDDDPSRTRNTDDPVRRLLLGVLRAFVGLGVVILALGVWPILTGNRIFYADPIYDVFLITLLVVTATAYLFTRLLR